MSHIATEEWQSFELRMRRRRAERMLVHAETALDDGRLEEARAALDEARRLCPALPWLGDAEARLALAAAPVVARPAAARVGRPLALAASFLIVAAAGIIGWRFMRAPAASSIATPPAVVAAPAPENARPAPPSPPAIRIETEQVPPVMVSGSDAPVDQPPAPVAPPPATMKSAEALSPQPTSFAVPDAHAVGTAGPATTTASLTESPATTPVDTGINTPLGNETVLAPPQPGVDHVARASDAPAPVSEAAIPPIAPRADPSPSVSVPRRPDDVALVRDILDKYADAYTRLDADAAKAVWPSVNRAALSRAFNGLNEQRIAFSDCAVLVHSTQARATCSGSTTWEPKIGGGARTDVRRWAFDLEKSGSDWVIRDARVQNR
jgi:hypothetical protein